jgi:rhomboid protease GluP
MKIVDWSLKQHFLKRKFASKAKHWSLGTLLACYIMSLFYWNSPELSQFLAASPNKVFEMKEYWRLFTSSFIHADLGHFLSNSLMLTLMGYFVSHYFGSIMYPILGFLGGILINLIVIWDYPEHQSLIGASGIVHYLWGFWLINFLFIQKEITFARRFMKIIAVGIFILVPTEFKSNVSYYAHGVGLVLGLLFGLIYFLINRKRIKSYEQWEAIYDDEDDILDAEGNPKPYYPQ